MKKWFLILGLLVVVVAAMATSRRSFVQPMPTATGGFLSDRWYFSNVTETNNAPFQIGFAGTGTRVIEWGDGESTTTNGTVVIEHVYATAGSNVFSVRETSGSTTWFYFYNLAGRHRLKRILTEPNGMLNLTLLNSSFYGCSGLIGTIPSLSILTNLTAMDSAFVDCAGLTGSIPALTNLTLLNSMVSTFYNCTGLTGSIPSVSTLTNLTTIATMFRGCTGLTGSIPALNTLTKLTTLSGTFRGCTGLTGSIPPIDALTKLTTMSYAFFGCTGLTGSIPSLNTLTNITSLDSTFSGCTAMTGSYPSISELTKLTTLSSTFYNCRGLLGNTSTVDYIFGSGSRSNLTTGHSYFWAANGTFTNLLGAADDFIKLEKSASFTTNIYSTNGSYQMFYNQTNLTDYATMPADWK